MLIYRWAKKSANLKHTLALTGMFRFKPASQFVERYHSVMNYALSMEGGFGPLANYADRATAACWRSNANFCG
jgi:hypothetical protein